MARYEVGDAATLTTVITVDGQPTDSTDLELVLIKPDGTSVTVDHASLGHPATGTYRAIIALDQLNTWRYRWTSTDPMSAESGSFSVRPPAVMLCQVEDVEDETGSTFATAADRNKVRARIIRVSADVIGATGQKFLRAQRTVVLPGGYPDYVIVLPQRPVVSVDGITVDGIALTEDVDFRVVNDHVVRVERPWGYPGMWTEVVITYTAGYEVVPDDIVSLCARRVATQLEIPAGVRQYSIGSFSATVAEETIRSDWAADESATLARYSRKRRPGLVRVI